MSDLENWIVLAVGLYAVAGLYLACGLGSAYIALRFSPPRTLVLVGWVACWPVCYPLHARNLRRLRRNRLP